jgi:ankyrin repeat protein
MMIKVVGSSLRPIVLAMMLCLCGCSSEENLLDAYANKAAPVADEQPELRTTEVPSPQKVESPVALDEANPPISDQDFRDAAKLGKGHVVAQAIQRGINVNSPDADGRTALMLAAYDGHTEVVHLLIKNKSQVNRRDAMNRTALTYSASGKNPETVAVLLDADAEVDVVDNVESWTPLMFASAEGNLEVVKLLLKHGASPHLADKDGETSLLFAANNGHSAVVKLLEEEIAARKKP